MGNPLPRLVGYTQLYAALFEHLMHDTELDVDNLRYILLSEWLEHHNLVDAVEELRFEVLLQLLDNLVAGRLDHLVGECARSAECA